MKTVAKSLPKPLSKSSKKPDLSSFSAKRATGAPNKELETIIGLGEVLSVDLDLVDRDENQPRPLDEVLEGLQDFADDLERDDFVLAQHPIYHMEDNGRFTVVVGERRTAAFKLKGRQKITAVCKKFTAKEKERIYIIQYVENDDSLKKQLSPIADAKWWRNYADMFHGGEVKEAAKARGRSESDVSNRLALLAAPEFIQAFAKTSKLRDPATFAALIRLQKRAGDSVVESVITDYLDNKIQMSLRTYVENTAKLAKQNAKNTNQVMITGSHAEPEKIIQKTKQVEEVNLEIVDNVNEGVGGPKGNGNKSERSQTSSPNGGTESVKSNASRFTDATNAETELNDIIKILKKAVFSVRLLSADEDRTKHMGLLSSINTAQIKLKEVYDSLENSVESEA